MNRWVIAAIDFYRNHLSTQVFGAGKCKFIPTCSQYARSAFETYGFWKALRLSAYRVLRCNPFGKGGYDPLP